MTHEEKLLDRIVSLEEDLEVWKIIAHRYIESFLLEIDPENIPDVEKELDLAWQEVVKQLDEDEKSEL